MHTNSIAKWQHTHIFGQDQIQAGERRTLLVVIITGIMMVVEILVGIFYGSMALLADGIHMGSHMVGLLIALIAYILARKYANDERFSFGTGKINSLAGFTSALFLFFFVIIMGWESIQRFFKPVEIHYNMAILVAVVGLIVNGISMLILGEHGHTHDHNHNDAHVHDHGHGAHVHDEQTVHEHDHHNHSMHEDQNLRGAYLHVFADAMTSILAIIALLAAKYFGWVWADPLMGIIGAIMVARWCFGLIGSTTKVLLDYQGPKDIRERIVGILESYKDTRVSDLHLWGVGPGIYSANLSIVTQYPDSPDKYKSMIPEDTGIVHVTVEINPCTD